MYHFQAYHTIDNGVSLFEISHDRSGRLAIYLSVGHLVWFALRSPSHDRLSPNLHIYANPSIQSQFGVSRDQRHIANATSLARALVVLRSRP